MPYSNLRVFFRLVVLLISLSGIAQADPVSVAVYDTATEGAVGWASGNGASIYDLHEVSSLQGVPYPNYDVDTPVSAFELVWMFTLDTSDDFDMEIEVQYKNPGESWQSTGGSVYYNGAALAGTQYGLFLENTGAWQDGVTVRVKVWWAYGTDPDWTEDGDSAQEFVIRTVNPTPTVAPTDVPTDTPTNTVAPTNTPIPTPTSVPTNTAAPTATPIPTNTPVPTPTQTPLPPIPTATPTYTRTPTVTPSVTPSPTVTPSSTPTPSNTPTVTNTPTGTLTPTPTFTSSPTPSNTMTPTHTPTATSTPEDTATPTFTSTNTPTNTVTNTPTITPTFTATPTTAPQQMEPARSFVSATWRPEFQNWLASFSANGWWFPQPSGSSPRVEAEAQVSSDLSTWTVINSGTGTGGFFAYGPILDSSYGGKWIRTRTIRVFDDNGLYAPSNESFSQPVFLAEPTSTPLPPPTNTPDALPTATPTPPRDTFLFVIRDGIVWRTLTK